MSPEGPSSSVGVLFQEWLTLSREEGPDKAQAFLESQPQEIREELERMVFIVQLSTPTSFKAGMRFGDFELSDRLGCGGYGEVWKATQLTTRREVALKLLWPRLATGTALERFQREATAAARINHPNVVQIHTVGEHDGVHFLAEELINGGRTLHDLFNELRVREVLPRDYYRATAQRFAILAEALEEAHRSGVIHRDLKPSNILLAAGDTPKIADFGLAHLDDEVSLSLSGEFLGTTFYMSPEQATAKRMGIDHRTDVFSLGSTFYEALTLRRAFEDDAREGVIRRLLMEEPPLPTSVRSGIPLDLETICLKALEKDPGRRYQSMAALAEDIRNFMEHRPIVARPPGAVRRTIQWTRRHPVASVAVLSLALVAFLMVVLFVQARRYREEINMVASRWAIGEATRQLVEGNHRAALDALELCDPKLSGWEWHHLKLSAGYPHRILAETGKPVHCVAVSADGSLIAAASEDGSIGIWKLDGTVLQRIQAHQKRASGVAFFPDGDRLVSASDDGTMRVWDLDTGNEEVSTLSRGAIECVSVRPDGSVVAGGCEDGSVILWDPLTDDLPESLPGSRHSGPVQKVSFSRDGGWIASASDDGVKVWDLDSREIVHTPTAHVSAVSDVLFDHDNDVWSFSHDQSAICWDIETGLRKVTILAHGQAVWSAAFHPGGGFLATASQDSNIILWDLEARSSVSLLSGHLAGVNSLVFPPSSDHLVSASDDGTIRIWELAASSLTTVGGHQSPVQQIAFSPDGAQIVTCADELFAIVWETSSLEMLAVLRTPHSRLTIAAFSPEGHQIITGCADGSMKLWDASSFREIGSFPGHSEAITELALDPVRGQLISASLDGSVRIWDMLSREEVSQIEHDHPVNSVAVDLVRGRIAAGCSDGTVSLWDLESHESLGTLTGHTDEVLDVSWSPTRDLLVSASQDRTVRVWALATPQRTQILREHRGEVVAACFSPEGNRLYTAGPTEPGWRMWAMADRVYSLGLFTARHGGTPSVAQNYDLASAQPILGSASNNYAIAFSPSGALVASGHEDSTLRHWASTEDQAREFWNAALRRQVVRPIVEEVMDDNQDVDVVATILNNTPELDERHRLTAVRLARALFASRER